MRSVEPPQVRDRSEAQDFFTYLKPLLGAVLNMEEKILLLLS